MTVAAQPLHGWRAFPRLFPLVMVMATATIAGATAAWPLLAAGLLVASGLVMALTSRAAHSTQPATHVVVLHVLVPLQVLATVWLRPGNLEVLFLVGVVALTAWLTATEIVRRLAPVTVERAVLISTAALALAYLAYATPRLGSRTQNAWVDVAAGGQWLNANALVLVFLIGLAIAIARGFSEARSTLSVVAGIACGAAVLLTFSRSGYLALAAMLLVLTMVRRRAILAVGALAVVLVTVVPSSVRDRIVFTTADGGLDPSSTARLDLWEAALGVIADMPLLGSGIHALSAAVEQQGGPSGFTFVHNTYLSLLAGFGLPIGALVLFVVARSFLRRLRVARSGRGSADLAAVLALAATAVCSFFGEPLLTPVTVAPLAALLGLRDGQTEVAD